jgi:hypothetical protein
LPEATRNEILGLLCVLPERLAVSPGPAAEEIGVSTVLAGEHGDGKIQGWHRDRLAVIYQLSELAGESSQLRGRSQCAGLRSLPVSMIGEETPRDLAALVVLRAGRLEQAEDPWERYRLLDTGTRDAFTGPGPLPA